MTQMMSIITEEDRRRLNRPIGGKKMNDSNYLTETEKFLFGYTEYIPSEYPPYDSEEWDNEELEVIEELNEIFNL